MGSCCVVRKGFQRAHAWGKFKHSGKIYCSERKEYTPEDIEGRQAVIETAPRSLIILHIFSWFSGTSRLVIQTIELTPWVFPGLCWVLQLINPFPASSGGLHPIQSHSYPRFSQAGFHPFMSPLWLLLCMPQSSASSPGFCCACTCSPCGILASAAHAPRKDFPLSSPLSAPLLCKPILPAPAAQQG